MNRQEKQAIVGELRNDFSRSDAAFLVEVKGLTVDQLQGLRKNVRKQGGSMHVAKNTLFKIAIEGISGVENLQPHFKQQIAVVFASQEPSAVAKVLHTVAKENERFAIVAGYFDGSVIGVDKINFLATLPSREQILAQLLGAIRAPLTVQAIMLQALHTKLSAGAQE